MDVAALQKLLDPLFPGLMGVTLVALAPERVVAEMTVRPDLCTAGGILHGGAAMAFADTLGAVGTIVNLAPGKRTTTTDSSTNSSPRRVSARSSPASASRSTAVAPRWSGRPRSATPTASCAASSRRRSSCSRAAHHEPGIAALALPRRRMTPRIRPVAP